MGAGWVINVLVAEWAIRRGQTGSASVSDGSRTRRLWIKRANAY
jgi:hypothetical protein